MWTFIGTDNKMLELTPGWNKNYKSITLSNNLRKCRQKSIKI